MNLLKLSFGLVAAMAAIAPLSLSAEDSLPDALAGGTPSANLRLRAEQGDQEGKETATALTSRLRLGYVTGEWHGLDAGVEFSATRAADRGDYNAAGVTGDPDKSVIADPPSTTLTQGFLRYRPVEHTSVTVGRQVIVLDNARFIGNVGWRQQYQTYDAVTVRSSPVEGLDLFYGYVDEVQRIFGSKASGAKRALDSESHLVNVSYAGVPGVKLGAYAYLLEFENAAALSSDTFGGYATGMAEVSEGSKLSYRVEAATQEAAGNHPSDGSVAYLHGSLVFDAGGVQVGGGYEELGAEDGYAFQTPLATLHAFNGWADVFLSTPENGLEDMYLQVGAPLPGGLKGKAVYHWFSAAEGGMDYGEELDLVLARPVGKAAKVIAKYSNYRAGDYAVDTERVSLELNVHF